jgi:acyl-CoA synthetase (AMP-forming)/AMP-acid ligase II
VKEQALSDVEFNLALTQEAVSAAVPDREYLIWRDRRFTYSQLTDRSRRLASYLHQRGLGVHVERQLAGHESGQDHVALYMRNCNEFIEAMLGSFKSRTVPVNVNYRYVADELRYLFRDAQALAVIYHADFAPMLAQVRHVLPQDAVLIQVADDSGNALLPGAVDFEASLAEGSPELPVAREDLGALLQPGTEAIGWLAQTGNIPLGYLCDPDKTARTFPVIDGVRYAVPGDRARLLEDGSVQLLGRDSVTINSGGEKIFAEEVEAAVTSHPSIADVIVTRRPSERWGQEVVALVQLVDSAQLDEAALARHAEQSLARYKLPKAWIQVPEVRRSPVGKADYRWANSIAVQEVTS